LSCFAELKPGLLARLARAQADEAAFGPLTDFGRAAAGVQLILFVEDQPATV